MRNATSIWPRLPLTVVFGSVIMKKMNNWYIGPVSGEISASHGFPVIQLRTNARARNEPTYVAQIWKRRTRHTITEPKVQITTMGHRALPHWILIVATAAGTMNTI